VTPRSQVDLPHERLDPAQASLLTGSLLVAFSYVFLANAWLGDDAYITFRVAQNFIHGHGLTFNPGERVQAYTHPLWMLLLSAASAITSEFFFTTLAVSYALCVLVLVVVFSYLRSLSRSALFLGFLLSSKAFVDYTSSGLEYPLSYLLIAWFYCRFFQDVRTARQLLPRDIVFYGLLASLAFLNRGDSILLYAGPLAYVAYRAWPIYRWRIASLFLASFAPSVIWLAFSYLYYGFPFPNTYYAKVATGIPRSLRLEQGIAYFANSINFDAFTLGTVALAAGLAVRTRRLSALAGAGSALLYVVYTISIGGDFMSGRFFAMPLLAASILIVSMVDDRRVALILGAGLVGYNLVAPLAPIKTRASYDGAWDWHLQNGIKDERGYYHRITNVLFYDPFRTMPDHVWFREGLSFRNSDQKVSVQGSTGFFGFNAGPEKYVLDRNALSDPLLARLPVSEALYFEFYAGHFFRDIPAGYVESCREGKNLIEDPLIHDYYDKLLNITRGPIFSVARARDIWELNFGRYRALHDLVNERRVVALSVPAVNTRFITDVGERDTRARVLRSVGRAGYLQTGPHIPLKPGRYRARWIGVVEAAASQEVGFVDVWVEGERLLNKRPVLHAGLPAEDKVLAEIEFILRSPTSDLEYRFYVNDGTRVVLERIVLESSDTDCAGRGSSACH